MTMKQKNNDGWKLFGGIGVPAIMAFGFGVQHEQEKILSECITTSGYVFYLNGHKKIRCSGQS